MGYETTATEVTEVSKQMDRMNRIKVMIDNVFLIQSVNCVLSVAN